MILTANQDARRITSAVGLYVMTPAEVLAFAQDVMSTTFLEGFTKTVFGDGAASLLGLRYFPTLYDTGTVGSPLKITLGNMVALNGPSVYAAASETVAYRYQQTYIPRVFGDHRDFTVATYKINIPLVGIVDLNPADVAGRTLTLEYKINLSDGSASVILSAEGQDVDVNGFPSGGPLSWPVYIGNCQWGVEIPLRADSTRDIAGAFATALSIGGAPTGGIVGGSSSYSAGSLTPNTAWSGDLQAKVIIYHRYDRTGVQFGDAAGAPSGKVAPLSEFSGFFQAHSVYSASNPLQDDLTLTARRYDEIVALLKEGIYI